MNAYAALVAVHIATGAVALAAFWTAAALRKGSPAHRRVGQTYLWAMLGIVVTAVPLALARWYDGHPVTAAFLGYLAVITATGVWLSWRAVRDKAAPRRFTGPVFVALAGLSLVSGAGVLALGLQRGAPLLIGFSFVGIVSGALMLRQRAQRDRIATTPRWWLVEHYTAMVGNGIATHIAFLGIGLPRLLPNVDGTVLHYLAWFGPLGVALIAKLWLDRRWKPAPRPVAASLRGVPSA